MAKAISWVAVNKSGEVCLDLDPSPLPRGWERCLDLKSGVMYLKPSHDDNQGIKKGAVHKRKRLLFEDDHGAGDPALQLSLSLPMYSFDGGDSSHLASLSQMQPNAAPTSTSRGKKQAVACDNDSATSKSSCARSEPLSLIMNQVLSLPEAVQSKESGRRRDAVTSSNGSSPSYNASSSSSSSSPSGSQSKGLRANQWGLEGVNEEGIVIKARGCPQCFMYVLPSRNNPKCPRCKSHILVDLSPLSTH